MSFHQGLGLVLWVVPSLWTILSRMVTQANLFFERLHLAAVLCLEDHSGGWGSWVLGWRWPGLRIMS